LTLRSLGDDADRYGRIRLWGSIAFLAVVLGLGRVLDLSPRAPLVASALLLALCVPLAWTLPADDAPRPPALGGVIRRLLTHPTLSPLWPVALLHGTALSTYDHLYSLHVQRLGLPPSVTGDAVATGVLVETFVMAGAPWLLRRWPGLVWMRIAVVASVPRWILTAEVSDPTLQVLIQAAHGLTFGCWWVGGVRLLSERSPPELRNSAQALFIATTHGLGSLGAMAITAAVADRWGTASLFHLGAGLSLLAAVRVLRPMGGPRDTL
jgi:PPP family 3-phenylpropionic acid transporter